MGLFDDLAESPQKIMETPVSKQQSTRGILSDIGCAVDTLESNAGYLDDADRMDLLAMAETLESMADMVQNYASDAADKDATEKMIESEVGGF